MSARPALRAASGRGMSRRVQTAVIFLVLLASTTAATVALALLAVDSDGPFQRSFAAHHGADAVAGINAARASDAQLAATARLPDVTQAAGPFPVASVSLASGGSLLATVTAAGRASPGGTVDDLILTAGRWVRRPGEIVIASDLGQGPGTSFAVPIGTKVTDVTAPGKPRLTVVGMALSTTGTAGAWVVPAEIAALRASRAPAQEQMLYRFAHAGSAAQVSAGVAEVTAALPAGAVAGSVPWLTAEAQATRGPSSIVAPFVMAFAIMGLAMSVLIVTNVVSGAVVAGYRRIGVLRSIGLTPAQAVAGYITRTEVPALAGCLFGVVLGNVLAAPVLAHSATLYGTGSQSVPPWVDVAAPLGMCTLTGLAALLPALRAGSMSPTAAITVGQAPGQGRGYLAHRLLGGLRLPRPVTIGLAAPFARPARTAVTLAAILLGTTAVIFAVSLDASLASAATGTERAAGPGQVQVWTAPGYSTAFTSRQERQATAAIRAQHGTAHDVAQASPMIGVAGLTRQVNGEAFQTDAAWLGYAMVQGHWYSGPGQADVNTSFLTQTGLAVGDATSVSIGGSVRTVRIVGEVFDPSRQPALIASWQTLGGAAAGLTVDQYDISLRPGVSPDAYAGALQRALGPSLASGTAGGGQFFAVATSLIAMLTLMIAVVAVLGVLNTVLLGARERGHDVGVFKALGMTPRQTTWMVLSWVAGPAVVAAIIAVPAAAALHSGTVRAMASAAGTGIPSSVEHMLGPSQLAVLALSGLVIAAVGAMLPASWAARSPAATALRAE
jgi:putative ABC transport system permease protein